MAMSQREKFLAIAVGSVVGLVGVQFIYNSLRSGIVTKQNQLAVLEQKIEGHEKKITDCQLSLKRMVDLKPKSLPKNAETAKNQYADWLYELAQKAGVQKREVLPQAAAGLKSDGFTTHRWVLSGEVRLDNLIKLLHGYYDRDYLQRIRGLKITQLPNNPEIAKIALTTEAIALTSADLKQAPSLASSGRVSGSVDDYLKAILEKNPFTPPNKAPKFNLADSLDVPRGVDYALDLKATDPENRHKIKYTLVSDKPSGLNFDESGKINWKPTENGKYELVIEAIDDGLPAAKTQQKVVLKVIDPPAVEPPKVEPQFDVASQSYVSAVLGAVRGGEERSEVWIRSKTDNKSFIAVKGDDISVGSIKGKIVDVNVKEQFAEVETDGRRWTVSMNDASIQAAYKRSLQP